jgi:hypothetical protein
MNKLCLTPFAHHSANERKQKHPKLQFLELNENSVVNSKACFEEVHYIR